MANRNSAQWHETSSGIYFVVADAVQFFDDFDHWKNGFCRLLEIEQGQARALVESIVLDAEPLFSLLSLTEKTEAIKKGVRNHFKMPPKQAKMDYRCCGTAFDGTFPDAICAHSISGNTDRLIVGNGQLQHGWQIDGKTFVPIKADSVLYDENYFENPTAPHSGMRDYVSQEQWRLNKSRRLLRLILSNTGSQNPHVEPKTLLDIGSGAGYVRKAASELQMRHFGIDSSPSAIEICKSKFGFETMAGNVADLPKVASHLESRCDYITLFDVIEHLDDPVAAINNLKPLLAAGGCIVIRTPNLVSFEYDALADYYYSFKLDHLQYFSANSLDKLMTMCGLTQVFLETSSHLFKGLLGMDFIHQCGKGKIGADILAIYS